MKTSTLPISDTQKRILEAAGEIFVEAGFQHATVREICNRAQANVAAVNYHFGNKEKLYVAVFRYGRDVAFQQYPWDLGTDVSSSPEDRLRAFIRSFLLRTLSHGQASWIGKLMAREFFQPTKAFDVVIKETIRPAFNLLSSIVKQLLGNRCQEESLILCCMSIVGQCLYPLNARQVIARLLKRGPFNTAEIERIASHITRFSLCAIQGMAKETEGAR